MACVVDLHAFDPCTGVHDVPGCFQVLRNLASAKAGANRMEALLNFATSSAASVANAMPGEMPGRRCKPSKAGAGHARASKSLNQT